MDSLSPYFSLRRVTLLLALVLAVGALAYEIAQLLPTGPGWQPQDYYSFFLPWGTLARRGIPSYRYPLPTTLWLFVPISFLPEWFGYVWTAIPCLLAFYRLGRRAIAILPSYPFLVQIETGQLDGFMMLPLYWLIIDHPLAGGISAAVLLFKPQLAIFPVPFMLFRWLHQRNWKSLALFGTTFALIQIPALVLDPTWPVKMLPDAQARLNEDIQVLRNATLWDWSWRGPASSIALPFVAIIVAYFFWRALRDNSKRTAAVHLIGLLCLPVFYAVSFVTAIPILRLSWKRLIGFTIVSWFAVSIDVLGQGFGGAYAFIPIYVLVLLAFEPAPWLIPPSPTKRIEPKDITREGRKDIL